MSVTTHISAIYSLYKQLDIALRRPLHDAKCNNMTQRNLI